MKSKNVTALGVTIAIATGGVVVGEQEWCEPVCDAIIEQPHVPHEPHLPQPTRAAIEFVTSGSSSADVPFIPFDDTANMIAIRAHHERRLRQSLIASMSSSSVFSVE